MGGRMRVIRGFRQRWVRGRDMLAGIYGYSLGARTVSFLLRRALREVVDTRVIFYLFFVLIPFLLAGIAGVFSYVLFLLKRPSVHRHPYIRYNGWTSTFLHHPLTSVSYAHTFIYPSPYSLPSDWRWSATLAIFFLASRQDVVLVTRLHSIMEAHVKEPKSPMIIGIGDALSNGTN